MKYKVKTIQSTNELLNKLIENIYFIHDRDLILQLVLNYLESFFNYRYINHITSHEKKYILKYQKDKTNKKISLGKKDPIIQYFNQKSEPVFISEIPGEIKKSFSKEVVDIFGPVSICLPIQSFEQLQAVIILDDSKMLDKKSKELNIFFSSLIYFFK